MALVLYSSVILLFLSCQSQKKISGAEHLTFQTSSIAVQNKNITFLENESPEILAPKQIKAKFPAQLKKQGQKILAQTQIKINKPVLMARQPAMKQLAQNFKTKESRPQLYKLLLTCLFFAIIIGVIAIILFQATGSTDAVLFAIGIGVFLSAGIIVLIFSRA